MNAKLLRINEVNVIPETKEAIELLKQTGIGIAAVSNSITGDAGASLTAAGFSLTETFNFCLFRDELRDLGLQAKPSPDPYNHARKVMEQKIQASSANENKDPLLASECLVFEDSKTGVRAGLAAGMNVIHLTDESGPMNQAEVTKALAEKPGATYHPVTRRELVATCKKLMSLG